MQAACLPIDLIFGTNLTDLKGNHITYIENLKKRMAWAYEIANDIVQKEQEQNKQHYDCKIRLQSWWLVIQYICNALLIKVSIKFKIGGRTPSMKL